MGKKKCPFDLIYDPGLDLECGSMERREVDFFILLIFFVVSHHASAERLQIEQCAFFTAPKPASD